MCRSLSRPKLAVSAGQVADGDSHALAFSWPTKARLNDAASDKVQGELHDALGKDSLLKQLVR